MAITVRDNEYSDTTYTSGEKWVIDEFRQLHIVAREKGNLASYAEGAWSKVFRSEDPAANPTSADAPALSLKDAVMRVEANDGGLRTENAYYGHNTAKLT